MDKIKDTFKRIIAAKHFKRYLIASVVIVIGIVIFAVSALQGNAPDLDDPIIAETTPTPEPTPTPTPDATPEPTPASDTEPAPDAPREPRLYNPLTGEPRDEDLTHYRPFAFVLNNLSVALPHAGTAQVDILYEFPVEGGVTRMVAIIQDPSDLGAIGTIRSARYYFVCISESYDAIFVHAGDSWVARDLIRDRGIDNLNGVTGTHGRLFYRDDTRRRTMGYEHSMMTTGQRIVDGVADFNIRTEHAEGYERNLRFTENAAPVGGGSAKEVVIRATSTKNSSFTYNEDSGQYFMRQFGRNFIDETTGEQVGFTNILVLQTSVTAWPGCRAGLRVIETTGRGTGFFINGGYYTEIMWSRADESSQFEYTLPDGSPLYLGIGRTFISVVPNDLEHIFE